MSKAKGLLFDLSHLRKAGASRSQVLPLLRRRPLCDPCRSRSNRSLRPAPTGPIRVLIVDDLGRPGIT
jgi:hypothetical protein